MIKTPSCAKSPDFEEHKKKSKQNINNKIQSVLKDEFK